MRQLDFAFAVRRKRRRACRRNGVSHQRRAPHHRRHPIHVTMRRCSGLPSMRAQSIFHALCHAFAASARSWFRVVHLSIQRDHVHLIVEADDGVALTRGMTGLAVRLARAYNHVVDRHGRVWSDRYHSRPLQTPKEVRHALAYVLLNFRKHEPRATVSATIDVCSSGWWFQGWARPPRSPPPGLPQSSPVTP
jgi:REP-associated tyrosine transposase